MGAGTGRVNRAKPLTGRADEPYNSAIPGIVTDETRCFEAARRGRFAGLHTDFDRTAMTPDFDSEWLDTMVKKLITVLQNQLEGVAQAQADAKDARARAADARTLSSLERTLERLSRLERERAAVKEKKIAKHDIDNARAALERRLDKRLAATQKGEAARKS
jgi:hypothetical protein